MPLAAPVMSARPAVTARRGRRSTWPLTYDASAEQRNAITPATSSGWPTRRTGVCAATAAVKSSNGTPIRAAVCSVIAVAMKPGATELTMIPNGPSSIASVLASPWSPAFAAE